jgi:hypothetical protein
MVAGKRISLQSLPLPIRKRERLQADESERVEWRIQRVFAKKQAGIDAGRDRRHKRDLEKRLRDCRPGEERENVMKASKMILLIAAGFTLLATPRSHAQSEIAPDHFESPNTEPFSQPKTQRGNAAKIGRVRFDGKVTLPYSVICSGRKLQPGRYSVSLRSDGKTGLATLNQSGQTLEIAGAVRRHTDPPIRNSLLVECIGKTHKLSAILVKEVELVFDSDLPVEHTPDGKPRRIEKLLLTQTTPQK